MRKHEPFDGQEYGIRAGAGATQLLRVGHGFHVAAGPQVLLLPWLCFRVTQVEALEEDAQCEWQATHKVSLSCLGSRFNRSTVALPHFLPAEGGVNNSLDGSGP